MLVFGHDGQSDRPDQDLLREEHDRKVDECICVEFLLLARNPLLGGASRIGIGEKRACRDLFHSGQPLYLWRIARMKSSEQKPFGSDGREGSHGRDETTDKEGLTIMSGKSLVSS